MDELGSRPKRNSGRTGRRRLTYAEAELRGPQAIADHRRRYGVPLQDEAGKPAADDAPKLAPAMPSPPQWFTGELRAVWSATIAAAPSGLLRAGDADNLVVLCAAINLHRRLARQLVEQTEGSLPAELIQQLRSAGTEVGRASRALGLTPPERARIGLPAPTPEQKAVGRWGPVVIDGDKLKKAS